MYTCRTILKNGYDSYIGTSYTVLKLTLNEAENTRLFKPRPRRNQNFEHFVPRDAIIVSDDLRHI